MVPISKGAGQIQTQWTEFERVQKRKSIDLGQYWKSFSRKKTEKKRKWLKMEK